MDPPGRHRQTWCISEHRNRLGPIQTDIGRRGALVSTKQVGTLQADTERRGALVSTKTGQDPSGRHKQTRCISEHRNRLRIHQTDTDRRGALVSTKQIGILQADTDRRGALASTKTDLGSSRQTQSDVVH